MLPEVNTIYNQDNLVTMANMPNEFVDLVVTSPPYDERRTYTGYSFDFEQTAKELYRVTKSGGVVVWVVSDSSYGANETGTSFKQALFFKECGFNLFDTMIYAKPPRGAVGNNKSYWQTFEYMFVLSKGSPKTINLICDRPNQESRNGDRGTKRLETGELKSIRRGGYGKLGRRTNIWEYKVGKGKSASDSIAHNHPAIFPEALAQDHIRSWSNEHELIYDPFIGSGTTAKMSLLNNRNFIGSEISPEYCKLATKRINHYVT
jgi:site-specific DNA-methyltransferase (adenine-specific)|tara:strand:+ start:455 stop:1240 length:786 start_codon:yes stop_codon:yes gene_type:complete